jgi:glycosyltransferase involved in cell wall biosynthesis
MDDLLAMSVATSHQDPGVELAPRRRVLHVINSVALGGAEKALLLLATKFDRSLYEPEVASLELPPEGDLSALFDDARIPVHRLRRRGEPLAAGWPRLLDLIERTKPDIVHTHLVAAGIAGRLAARLKRVPAIVSTLHNVSDWEEKRRQPLRWLDRRTLPLADRVITVSEAAQQAFARVCPGLGPRATTIRNGVALNEFRAVARDRATARAQLGYAADDFVIGTVARLEQAKGLDVLIEAMAIASRSLPQVRLLLVGDGPERDRLAERARAHAIAHLTRFTGRQVHIRPYLAAMDVFAAPSRTEGLGIAIIEALAAGLPVIGARVGGIPEVIENGVSGLLLPPNDASAWAGTIGALAVDEACRQRFATAAPGRAELFALDGSVRALERIYDEVLEPLGGRAKARIPA